MPPPPPLQAVVNYSARKMQCYKLPIHTPPHMHARTHTGRQTESELVVRLLLASLSSFLLHSPARQKCLPLWWYSPVREAPDESLLFLLSIFSYKKTLVKARIALFQSAGCGRFRCLSFLLLLYVTVRRRTQQSLPRDCRQSCWSEEEAATVAAVISLHAGCILERERGLSDSPLLVELVAGPSAMARGQPCANVRDSVVSGA